jgi:hypothetical protein
MQRIIGAERTELRAKRNAMERELGERLAEIERAAAADRTRIEALREQIQKAGEMELERIRALAVEDLDSSDFRMHTGNYAAPAFIAPKLEPLPELVFRRDEHLKQPEQIADPTLSAEPLSMLKVVRKLQSPRRKPRAWRRWAVRGGIAAAILLAAGTAVMMESRVPVNADTLGATARPTRSVRAVTTPASPAVTDSSAGRLGAAADSASAPTGIAATTASDSAAVIATPSVVVDSARVRARRDSLRRAAAALARTDSAARASTTPRRRAPRADPQDLMDLSDSLSSGTVEPDAPAPPTLPGP